MPEMHEKDWKQAQDYGTRLHEDEEPGHEAETEEENLGRRYETKNNVNGRIDQ
jgi:hypothetical protein